MEQTSRGKEPSAFAWIFSGALGTVLGVGMWVAGRSALRRKADARVTASSSDRSPAA